MPNYTTTQGDMWDMIALRVYGDENLMHKLVEANPDHRHTVVFPANIALDIPEAEVISASIASPAWKRGGG